MAIVSATLFVLSLFDMLPAGLFPDPVNLRAVDDSRFPIAMLGDSDSQGYRDTRWMVPPARGGRYRDITLQWTEVLAELRQNEVDLGDFGTWGGRQRVVQFMEALGFARRLPRKLDHQYNFAFAGAHCSELMEGDLRQAPRLRNLMDRDPDRWRRGVVIVRIGIINLSGVALYTTMASDPHSPAVAKLIDTCTAQITTAVRFIQEHHPETRFVLVGILDDTDCPGTFDDFKAKEDRDHIRSCLDRFDDTLRQLAKDDKHVTFFDDRAWFRRKWGSRADDGSPGYRTIKITDTLQVTHSSGDAPTNSVLADNHAGLVWNALWCQSLSATLAGMGLPITPIRDEEVENFLVAQCARIR